MHKAAELYVGMASWELHERRQATDSRKHTSCTCVELLCACCKTSRIDSGVNGNTVALM